MFNNTSEEYAHLTVVLNDTYRVYRVFVGKPEGRVHLEDICTDGMIILERIFMKQMGAWIGLLWLRIGTGGGLL
jgi:hypothetical protein